MQTMIAVRCMYLLMCVENMEKEWLCTMVARLINATNNYKKSDEISANKMT